MTDIKKVLADLQMTYLKNLPDKIESLRNALQKHDVRTLEDDFHKLKGTGKTYGLPEISQVAQMLEHLCADQPGLAAKAVPLAIELLLEIHKCRTGGKPYPLEQAQQYQEILRLLKAA